MAIPRSVTLRAPRGKNVSKNNSIFFCPITFAANRQTHNKFSNAFDLLRRPKKSRPTAKVSLVSKCYIVTALKFIRWF